MRIVVNDIAASSGGALTVLKDFYQAICSSGSEHEWIFLLGDKYFKETDKIKIRIYPKVKSNRVVRVLFDLFYGRRIIRKLNPDVIFSLQNTICFGLKQPQVLFVHQPLPFQKEKRFSFLKRGERSLATVQYLIGAVIKASIRKASKVIVQTEWMSNAIINQCRISRDKIKVFSPTVSSFENRNGTCYQSTSFFYPTSLALYKNIACIENAVALLEKEEIECHVELTNDRQYISRCIHGIGKLEHSMVEQKYFESTLIFPSYIETFGYPLAEARVAGSIILASDCDFSHEVLSDYPNAYFFDYRKPEELAELMKKVISGEIARKIVASEPTNEKVNTWQQIISEVIYAKDIIHI